MIRKTGALHRLAAMSALSLISLFLLCTAGYGSEKTVSLKEAVSIALNENHDLKASGFELGAQGEDVGIARSALLPQLSFEERFMRTNNPPSVFSAKLNQQRFSQQDFSINSLNQPNPINDFQTSVSVSQQIFSLKSILGLDMAKIQKEAKAEELSQKRQETAFRTVMAFLSIQTARHYVKAAERSVEDASEHQRIARLRYDSGLGLYSDVLRSSTALAESNQRLVTSQTNLNLARRNLEMLLGLSEPVDADEEVVEFPLRDPQEYIRMSSSRSDIKAVELYIENAKKGVKVAEAGYLPTIGMGGAYQLNDHRSPFGSEGDSWTVQAFLRWDLFDGLRREHERSKAKYQVSQARERLEALKSAVSFKIHEARLGVDEAGKNLQLADSALKSAEEGKRLVELRYSNSLAPLVDLMDAQANLDHARAAQIARTNEYSLAKANLSYQGGSILGDLGLEK